MKKLLALHTLKKPSLSSAPLNAPDIPDQSSQTFQQTLHLFQGIWNLEHLPTQTELQEFKKQHAELKQKVTPHMPVSNALLSWMSDKFELIQVVHDNPDLKTTLGEEREDGECEPIKTHNVWIKLNKYVGNEKVAGLMYYLMGCKELHVPSILIKDSAEHTRQIQGTIEGSVPVDQYKSENGSFKNEKKDPEKMILATIMAMLLGLNDDHGMNSVVSQTETGVFPVRFDHKHCGQTTPTGLLLEYRRDGATDKFLSLRTHLWEYILDENPDVKPNSEKLLNGLQTVLNFCEIFSSKNNEFTKLHHHIKTTASQLMALLQKRHPILSLQKIVHQTHPHTLPLIRLLGSKKFKNSRGNSAGIVSSLNKPLTHLVLECITAKVKTDKIINAVAAYLFHCAQKDLTSPNLLINDVVSITNKEFKELTINSSKKENLIAIKHIIDKIMNSMATDHNATFTPIFSLEQESTAPTSSRLSLNGTPRDVLRDHEPFHRIKDVHTQARSVKAAQGQTGAHELTDAV